MTLITLYRPLLNSRTIGSTGTELRTLSTKMAWQAANGIATIFGYLHSRGLITRLPDTAIAALEPAMTTLLLHSMSGAAAMREKTLWKFSLCCQVLQELRKVYTLAETTVAMMEAMTQRLRSRPGPELVETAAPSQAFDKIPAVDVKGATAPMTVLFEFELGQQETDQPEGAENWEGPIMLDEELGVSKRIHTSNQHSLDIDVDTTSDLDMFDQLMSWDAP